MMFIQDVKAESIHKTFWHKDSEVHYIIKADSKISVGFTIYGNTSGVNCSYFNINTMKTVSPGLYNRPFIIIKDSSLIISDNKEDLTKYDDIVSAGSWLIKDSKVYNTNNDHFSKSFKTRKVNRTCLGINSNNETYLIVVTKANFQELQSIGKKLNLSQMINLDGGTSTHMIYKGKTTIGGKRKVANYLIFE